MVGGDPRPLGVLVVCSGLGHAFRGFETFAHELHVALGGRPDVRSVLALAHGRPAAPGERRAPTLPRDSAPARRLGRALGKDPYWVEQVVYGASLVPLLARVRPDVVVVSDWTLSHVLGRWRDVGRGRWRMLLSNGAPGPPPYDPAVDHVQHLTPRTLPWALDAGEPPERHTLLPLGVAMPPAPDRPAGADRRALRARLGLPADRPVVLSVAALNTWSKRLDHLVDAVAELRPRPFLAMLGEPEDETEALLARARDRLGRDGFVARTVAPAEVADHYRAADVFVLPSLHESMGRVLVEAASHGVAVCAHDSEVTRYVLGGHGRRADLTRPGALAALLADALREPLAPEAAAAQHADMRARFGWDALLPHWVGLLRRTAGWEP